MIPVFDESVVNCSWQQELRDMNLSLKQLLSYVHLDEHPDFDANNDFPIRATASYLRRIIKGQVNDPLLKQILPIQQENNIHPDFLHDPLGEQLSNPQAGIVHKYFNRLLIVSTASCAIHCRYCFRRHFDYQSNRHSGQQWQANLKYIQTNTNINEVIFSGGDPLTQSNKSIEKQLHDLAQLPQIKHIRFHTRLPIVLPSRLDAALLTSLKNCPKKIVFVIHCNHAQELDQRVANGCQALHQHGVTLLNQSVLLKGINDHPNTLITLSERLFACGVLPYYLHRLDKVQGAAHFQVDHLKETWIIQQMRRRLSGYLMPKFVEEIAGESGKSLIY